MLPDEMLNLYSVVLLIGVVQCAVVALALAVRAVRNRRRVDGWLAAVLVAVALMNAPYLLGFMGLYDRVVWLSNLPLANAFVTGPVVLGYVLAAAEPTRPRRWTAALFAPAALAAAIGLWVWTRTAGGGVAYDQTIGPSLTPFLGPAGLVFNALCVAMAVVVVRRVGRGAVAGTPAERTARWLRRFLGAVGIGVAIAAAFSIAYALGVPFSYAGQWWAHAGYTVLAYYVAVAGFGFASQFELAPARSAPIRVDRAAPPLTDDEAAEWRQRLDTWMQTHRPHRRPDLTLASLAAEVGLAPATLSHAINAGAGRNFNEYVNGYRVADVQARLGGDDADRLSLLGVALDCGFNSKATFNRAFRKETGMSPSAWWAAAQGATGRTSLSETPHSAL